MDAPADMMEMIDARPDAPPTPVDTDGDTVPDTMDNCPMVANTDQRDHDDDTHGDVCDHCPHLPSTPDPDGDSDGVGDDCDPRPGMPGDSIALFEGFYDATSILTWTSSGGGMWTVAGGALEQTTMTTSSTTSMLIAPGTFMRPAITTGATVIAFGNATNNTNTPHVSVAAGIDASHSYWCSVVDEGPNETLYASTFSGAVFGFPSTSWPGTFAANSVIQPTVALLDNHNVCTVLQGTSTTATVQGNTSSTNGGVAVATRTASASFDYVFVVEIGN